MKRRPRLIPQWRRAWRLSSVQLALLLAVLSALQTDAVPLLQGLLPERVWTWVTVCFAVAIALLRVVAQPAALGPDVPPTEGGPQ